MADLDKTYKITERVNGILEKTLNTVEPKFVKQVVEWVSKFQTSSGNLTRSKSNKDRIATFKTAIERHLQRAGYYDMISKFLVGFDEMSAAQTEIQQDLNAISLTKSFLNSFKRVAINQVITNMEKQGLLQSLINPLRNQLNIAVNQGSSLADTVASIRGQLETTEKRQGILKKLSLQSTRDALGQYDGTVNEAVRKTYKLDAILYVGSLVKDSRAQCERWTQYMDNGKRGLILFEQLEQEIMWADANGTGMIPNTTPENFCQNRGGFNCRHVAYPVRNPNKITTAGNVSSKVDADISTKEQAQAIEQLKLPVVGEFKFVEAKNIEEAKQRMTDLGIKTVDIDSYSKDQYNAMLLALENVPKKALPTIITNKKGYEDLTKLKINRKADEWMGLSLKINLYDKKSNKFQDEKIVVINSSGFKNPKSMSEKKAKYNELYSKATKGNKWYFNEFDGSSHFHELGHVYDDNKISSKQEWIEIANKWHKETKFDLLKPSKGGDFRGENGSEAFAEAFASYFGNQKKNLPSYVIEFFDKNIK